MTLNETLSAGCAALEEIARLVDRLAVDRRAGPVRAADDVVARQPDDPLHQVVVARLRQHADELESRLGSARAAPVFSFGGIQPPGSSKTTTSPRWMPPIRLTRILSCSWISGSIEPGRHVERLDHERPEQRRGDQRDHDDDDDLANDRSPSDAVAGLAGRTASRRSGARRCRRAASASIHRSPGPPRRSGRRVDRLALASADAVVGRVRSSSSGWSPRASVEVSSPTVSARGRASAASDQERAERHGAPTTRPTACRAPGCRTSSGRWKKLHRSTGQTITKTLPTTSSTGMKPPPGSPMCARESAEFSRLSPSTQRWSGGTIDVQDRRRRRSSGA